MCAYDIIVNHRLNSLMSVKHSGGKAWTRLSQADACLPDRYYRRKHQNTNFWHLCTDMKSEIKYKWSAGHFISGRPVLYRTRVKISRYQLIGQIRNANSAHILKFCPRHVLKQKKLVFKSLHLVHSHETK